VTTRQGPAFDLSCLFSPRLENVIEGTDRAVCAPDGKQRRLDPGVRILGIVLEIDGCGGPVILADRMTGRGIIVAPKVFGKGFRLDCSGCFGLRLEMFAQEKFGIGTDQALG